MNYKLILKLLLITSFLYSPAVYAAKKGVLITNENTYRINGVYCGRIKSTLFSGTILKTGRFYTFKAQLSDTKKLAASSSGSKKKKLLKKIKNLKTTKTEHDRYCSAITSNSPVPSAEVMEDSTSISTLGLTDLGKVVVAYCSANFLDATIWGTGDYTHDSAICTAALHAGVITRENGGNVIVKIKEGRSNYVGSTRNGISSNSYGSWPTTYAFLDIHSGQEIVISETQEILWTDTASSYASSLDQTLTFQCPAGGTSSSIWGTSIYTSDSSICTAAVHAGVITFDGGSVSLIIRGAQTLFTGSTANGVTTSSYLSYSSSFEFAA